MATVPTGYVFWDVSANKSYAAGKTFPTLGDGDYIVPATSTADGYYQVYFYHAKSFTRNQITFSGGWEGYVQSAYYSKTQKAPFNTIADKPVRSFQYDHCTFSSSPAVSSCTNLWAISWWQCTNLTSIPALPANLKSLYYAFSETKITSSPTLSGLSSLTCTAYAFYKCTSLTSAPSISGLTNLTDLRGMFQGCTSLVTPPALPASAIDTGYMFQSCTAMTSAPTLTANITSCYSMFRYCTSLTGFITVNTPESQLNGNYCFYDTTQTIILVGSGATTYLSKRNNNKNVYDGIKAYPMAFTAIRCDSDGNESASGVYVLLTVSYTALNYSGAKLVLPTLTKDGSSTSATWHIGTKDGTTLTSSGVQLDSTGKIVSIYYVGDNTTAPKFGVILNTIYNSYSWYSTEKQATTTYKEFIIDVRPDGKTIGIGTEASETAEGLMIDMPNFFLSTNGNFRTPMMAGWIIMHAGLTYPNGWFPCDGRELNRVAYPELFEAIGTTWGEGNGSTTFNIPDLCGRVPIGIGSGDGLTSRSAGDKGGTETHALTVAQMPAHNHTTGNTTYDAFVVYNHTAEGKNGLGETRVAAATSGSRYAITGGNTTFNATYKTATESKGSGSAHPNMQPYLAIRFIICAGRSTAS